MAWIPDSRHVRQSKYTVSHEESDVQVKNKQLLRPEGKNQENLPKRKNMFQLIYLLISLCVN